MLPIISQNAAQGIPFKVEPEASSYPLGRLNCDPPVALLRSVMEHMAHVAAEMAKKKGQGRPDFVLFTGGLVGKCLLMNASPLDYTFQNLNFEQKIWYPQQRVDSFEDVFTLSAFLFLGSKVFVLPLFEVIFQVINFHVNIIKRESLNWSLAECWMMS